MRRHRVKAFALALAATAGAATIAASGSVLNALVTEPGKSVCSAPDTPPAMLPVSPTIFAIVASASFTDWSVHGILCSVSWSYLSAPTWRR